ncbi:MAG: Gfo/Idh/MocA family oxidoreductase [Acidobacteria bacterium]|nr:Gfo/Idh/MocA family oxidoreductase [Acidobacteriota bacterium]
MDNMNRRSFVAGLAAPLILTKSAAGANDRVRVAVVGMHGQGKAHIKEYTEMPDVELAALCDVDESVLAARLKELDAKGVKQPKTYVDIRKVLEDKSIDAISIATPNHWHSLMGIWGCQAGKDVYVEKPCSHNPWEGRQLVEAAKKYNRIVQHGTNSRSAAATREAMQMLRDGVIGDVYMSRGLCFKWRDTIGRAKEEPVPPGVEYNLWTGPAPMRPFTRNRFHYNWHWQWAYGNGDIGNQGIHEMDLARWGLGVKLPARVESMGGHFMFDDDQETPNTQIATFEFNEGGKKKLLVFEVRHWMTNHEAGIGERGTRKDSNTVGNLYYGSKGYMAVDGYTGYRTYLGRAQDPGPARKEGGSNWANFIKAVRSRKVSDLNAPIEEGHLSATLVHLANISYRLGRAINFDPATEQIVGDEEASKMMTRQYRAPFVVPAKV